MNMIINNFNKKISQVIIFLLLNTLNLAQQIGKSRYLEEDDHEHDDHDDDDRDFSKSDAWGYAIGATIILGILGFLCSGVVILIKNKSNFDFKPVVKVLIAFAAGALIGDAFIHLIPVGYGAHKHDDHSDEEGHEGHEEEKEDELPPQGVLSLFLLLGFVIFYLFEKFMMIFGISHGHGEADDQDQRTKSNLSDEIKKQQTEPDQDNFLKKQSSVVPLQVGEIENKEPKQEPSARVETETEQQHSSQQLKQISASSSEGSGFFGRFKGKHPEGYLNLFGDFMHNIFDGVAIGGIFSTGNKSSSVSTFVAVLAHEIPQEIGDVGILLNSRFTNMQALFCNGCVNFSALIGAIFGLLLGELGPDADKFISLLIAGQFIYLAATDMFPLLRKEKNWKMVALQFFAFVLGVGALYLVLLIENESHEDHDSHGNEAAHDDHADEGDHDDHEGHDHDDHDDHNH